MDYIVTMRWRSVFVFVQLLIPATFQQTTSCQTCARDPNACREIRGTFGVTVMSRGYNPVVSIPSGACNINITELEPSSNFLALKTTSGKYIINGMWSIKPTGQHEGAGTVFNYNRSTDHCPGECISSTGPTTDNIVVQMLYHHTNPGVDYSYRLPPNTGGAVRRIEEHHRRHHHRQDKHTNPLDETEQRAIDNLKRGHHRTSENTNSTSSSPSTPRRRRPIFSSEFHRSRSSVYRRRRPDYISPFERRQSLSDVIANRRRQSLTDITYSRPVQVDDTYSVERPEYTSGLESQSNRIDTQYPSVTVVGSNDYSWRIAGFSECSQSCGGGIQETLIVCMLNTSQVTVTDDNCDVTIKPLVQHVNCNNSPCPPSWETDDWSPCSVTCGLGQQTRRVICKQRISATLSVSVSADKCPARKPAMVQQCQGDPCTRWNVGSWSECSVDCGEGQRRREVICQDAQGNHIGDGQCEHPKPRSDEQCDMGSCTRQWFFSRWQNQCSADCGTGVLSRQVHCASDDGERQSDIQCDVSKKPRQEKNCRSGTPCGGKWFAGPWGQCSVSCGVGTRSRDVACMKKVVDQFLSVGAENCQSSGRPADSESCDQEDCGTQWYMTDWTPCSVSCGGGVKRRYVRCLDGETTSSLACPDRERPPDVMRCNTDRCWTRKPEPATGCRDKFPNCRVVVQARLCRYSYYQKKCCHSCS